MLHKTVKATATTQDQGIFSALAASYSVDRMNEQIIPGAFEKTLIAWQSSGKNIPLHWDHQGEAANVIGFIDPGSAKETEQGLYVEGQLDLQNSEIAREAWRSMKNNAVSLSFGYLPKTRKGKNGVTEITEIDLFEISIVPAPANADTKLLSLKSAKAALKEAKNLEDVQAYLDENFPGHKIAAVDDGGDDEPERAKSVPQDPLRRRSDEMLLELTGGALPARRYVKPEPDVEPEPPDEGELRRRFDQTRLDMASG